MRTNIVEVSRKRARVAAQTADVNTLARPRVNRGISVNTSGGMDEARTGIASVVCKENVPKITTSKASMNAAIWNLRAFDKSNE